MSPATVATGGRPFTLTILGYNFTRESVVRWNGSDRPTTAGSSQVSASITAADIAVPGIAQIVVFNPPPGGGTSNALNMAIHIALLTNANGL